MNLKIRQCIFNIAGFYFLFLGIVNFISIIIGAIPYLREKFFYDGYSVIIPLISRILPYIAEIIISVILLMIAKKSSEANTENNINKTLKLIEGASIGILLIINSVIYFLNSASSQASSVLSYRDAISKGFLLPETAKTTLLLNIPQMALHLAGVLIGIWLLSRAKKRYGSDTESRNQDADEEDF